jgi:hypothetical protein
MQHNEQCLFIYGLLNDISNTDHRDLNGMMISEKSFGENGNELVMQCHIGGNTLAFAWMD